MEEILNGKQKVISFFFCETIPMFTALCKKKKKVSLELPAILCKSVRFAGCDAKYES